MDAGIGNGDGGQVIKLLAPLSVGDRLPWKIDRDGEPQWVVVIEAITPRSYLVRYPDGGTAEQACSAGLGKRSQFCLDPFASTRVR